MSTTRTNIVNNARGLACNQGEPGPVGEVTLHVKYDAKKLKANISLGVKLRLKGFPRPEGVMLSISPKIVLRATLLRPPLNGQSPQFERLLNGHPAWNGIGQITDVGFLELELKSPGRVLFTSRFDQPEVYADNDSDPQVDFFAKLAASRRMSLLFDYDHVNHDALQQMLSSLGQLNNAAVGRSLGVISDHRIFGVVEPPTYPTSTASSFSSVNEDTERTLNSVPVEELSENATPATSSSSELDIAVQTPISTAVVQHRTSTTTTRGALLRGNEIPESAPISTAVVPLQTRTTATRGPTFGQAILIIFNMVAICVGAPTLWYDMETNHVRLNKPDESGLRDLGQRLIWMPVSTKKRGREDEEGEDEESESREGRARKRVRVELEG